MSEETASSIFGFTEQRRDQLIGITVKCFNKGVKKDNPESFIVDASKVIMALEEELDITRLEGNWIAFKLGEACGNRIIGYMLRFKGLLDKDGGDR